MAHPAERLSVKCGVGDNTAALHCQKGEHPVVVEAVDPLAHNPVVGNVVAQKKAIHIIQALEKSRTEGLPALEHGLGVAPGSEYGARLAADLRPQPEVIVDLAVEHDDVSAIGRVHWLAPGRREILDRQAAVSECDAGAGIGPCVSTIRAAMGQRIRHCRGE